MTAHHDTVERMLHAYFHGDAATVMDCVTDDFTWINVALPRAAIRGREALAAKLAVLNFGLPAPIEHADHETTLVIELDDRLMHERIDRLRCMGRTVAIPCAAAFEMREGAIAAWRDYYDIGHAIRFFERIGISLDTSEWW